MEKILFVHVSSATLTSKGHALGSAGSNAEVVRTAGTYEVIILVLALLQFQVQKVGLCPHDVIDPQI